MYIFDEEGFQEMPATLVSPYIWRISEAFIKKHGTQKIREVSRKAMLYLRGADPAVHSFTDKCARGAVVDFSVRQKLRSVASSRGMRLASLIRECLHDHCLNGVKPVYTEVKTKSAVALYMSPFEIKLLKQWCGKWDCTQSDYFSTLAAVLEPMEEPDLVNLRPRREVMTYPEPVFYEKFAHAVRCYGYDGNTFLSQILAFLDRPFNPKRISDRYLDWLTNGYASTLRAS